LAFIGLRKPVMNDELFVFRENLQNVVKGAVVVFDVPNVRSIIDLELPSRFDPHAHYCSWLTGVQPPSAIKKFRTSAM